MTFEEWWNTKDYLDCCLLRCKRSFNEGRTELEKENAELKEELKNWKDEWQEQVQKAIDEGWERTKLTGRVRELEQQIEKMKCCENCKFKDCDKSNRYQTCWYCTNKDKWKLGR